MAADKDEMSKSNLMLEIDSISNSKDEKRADQKSVNHLFHPCAASESNMTDLMNQGVARKSKRDEITKTMITDTQSLNSLDCNRLSRADTIANNYFTRSTTTDHG